MSVLDDEKTATLIGARTRPVKAPFGDKLLNIVLLVVLTLFSGTILYPFLFIVAASISDPAAVNAGEVLLWPVGLSVDAYQAVLDYPAIPRSFVNSVFYAVALTTLACFLTLTGGYAMSRRDVPGKGFIMVLFVITMLFNGGMIPTYLLVRDLGMINTPWAMIVPTAFSVFQLIVTRTYYQVTIPHELLESSQLDGASDVSFFCRVVLPLSKPIIAVNVLLFAVASWNSYFNGLIYLTSEELYPLQLVMRDILLLNSFDASQSGADVARQQELKNIADQLKYALIIIASLPPLLLYPFVQKHFVKGMMIGSLKG